MTQHEEAQEQRELPVVAQSDESHTPPPQLSVPHTDGSPQTDPTNESTPASEVLQHLGKMI